MAVKRVVCLVCACCLLVAVLHSNFGDTLDVDRWLSYNNADESFHDNKETAKSRKSARKGSKEIENFSFDCIEISKTISRSTK